MADELDDLEEQLAALEASIGDTSAVTANFVEAMGEARRALGGHRARGKGFVAGVVAWASLGV